MIVLAVDVLRLPGVEMLTNLQLRLESTWQLYQERQFWYALGHTTSFSLLPSSFYDKTSRQVSSHLLDFTRTSISNNTQRCQQSQQPVNLHDSHYVHPPSGTGQLYFLHRQDIISPLSSRSLYPAMKLQLDRCSAGFSKHRCTVNGTGW